MIVAIKDRYIRKEGYLFEYVETNNSKSRLTENLTSENGEATWPTLIGKRATTDCCCLENNILKNRWQRCHYCFQNGFKKGLFYINSLNQCCCFLIVYCMTLIHDQFIYLFIYYSRSLHTISNKHFIWAMKVKRVTKILSRQDFWGLKTANTYMLGKYDSDLS